MSRGTIRGTNKESDDDLLSQAQCLLSLARERFTVLFGMGRGGSTLLWSSDKGVRIKASLFDCTWTQHSNCLGCFAILRSQSQLLYVTLVYLFNCIESIHTACLEEGFLG